MSASEVERARGVADVHADILRESQEVAPALDVIVGLLREHEAAVRAEEREACARIADTVCASDPDVIAGEIGHPPCCHAPDIAAAIRGRGTT